MSAQACAQLIYLHNDVIFIILTICENSSSAHDYADT